MSSEDQPSLETEMADTEGDLGHDTSEGMNYQEWSGVDEMTSLCMRCGEDGVTRMMLHKIPFFRELIIASFECEHCGERNNEVTFGGEIQLHGCIYDLNVISPKDLDRQLIKSDSASVRIPVLDFEIPAGTQKGEINTIEGFLLNAAKNLSMYQEERMEQMPEVGAKVAEIIAALTSMAQGRMIPFHIIVDDPAGNSFVENPKAPLKDPNMTVRNYNRTPEQDLSLGLQPEKGVFKDDKDSNFKALMGGGFGADKSVSVPTTPIVTEDENGGVRLGRSEVISIPSPCPNCQKMGESLTALTDIPHFKEVIIMAFDCNFCGFRNNEVKGGGAVPTYGTEVTLTVTGPDDLKRDVLKSDSCSVKIPELELELGDGTLGGVYTTVEGLLQKIHNNLRDNNPFAVGDSATLHHSGEQSIQETKARFHTFLEKLQSLQRGEIMPFNLILRDPLGNSFVSAPLGSFLPPEADTNLSMKDFERTYEENEEYGLNDINTKDFETGYENDEHKVVLPDRLTHVIPKGPDHPLPFAKGTEDASGGVLFTSTLKATTTTTTTDSQPTALASDAEVEGGETADGEWLCKPPPGWSAAKTSAASISDISPAALPRHHDVLGEGEDHVAAAPSYDLPFEGYGNRALLFSKDDFQLKYIPREEWGGRREGFVFRLGAQGIGYYEDRPPKIEAETENKITLDASSSAST